MLAKIVDIIDGAQMPLNVMNIVGFLQQHQQRCFKQASRQRFGYKGMGHEALGSNYAC
jgi:hypothetical protein